MAPKKRILLIEDDPSMVKIMQSLIKKLGFVFDVAIDGMEGLQKARDLNPDLIILDIMLPKLDGYKISRFLKFDEQYQHIPIIMLTAKSDKKDEKTGKATGANAYITKPFDRQNLIKTINAFIA